MRPFLPALALALTLSGAAFAAEIVPLAGVATELPVVAGQASYLNLGGAVRDIVIGDPTVADISVVNQRTLIVLGKRPGVTSLMVFGPDGRPLTDRQIVVSEVGASGVTVYRGPSATNYACASQCTRVVTGGAAPAAAPSALGGLGAPTP
jgi:Flp pilus assembly secretin CpaC